MARTKKRIFDGLYAQLEETDGNVYGGKNEMCQNRRQH